MAQTVKNLPTIKETQVQSLDQEDPLEKRMTTHSSILAWRMDRGIWWATVHGVTKNQTGLQELTLSLSHDGWEVQQLKCWQIWCLVRTAFWFTDTYPLLVSSYGRREMRTFWGLFYKATNPICEVSAFMT